MLERVLGEKRALVSKKTGKRSRGKRVKKNGKQENRKS
jgi:hypothetical protein